MSETMSQTIQMAHELAERAERNPVDAVKIAPKIRSLLSRALSEGAARGAASDGRVAELLARLMPRVERLFDPSAAPFASLGVTKIVRVECPPLRGLGESGQLKVDWPGGNGVCRSIFAGTIDGSPASLSRISVRINVNGEEDFFTDGSSPAFVPLIAFQPGNHNWTRLNDVSVSSSQRWLVTFRQEFVDPNAPPTNTITPFLLLGYASRNGG